MPYHHGNLRRDLLDTALRMFAEKGTLDFTLRELAREVGVTHAAPYRHFPSKADLVLALQEEVFAKLAAAEREALTTTPEDARLRVRALGEAYVRFAIAEPAAFRLVLAHPVDATSDQQSKREARESYTLLVEALEAAQKAGAARTDLSARELALGAWSLVHGLASLASSGRIPVGEARVRRYAELLDAVFFDGARPR